MEKIKIKNFEIDKDYITVDDMPSDTFRDIAEICGIDVALKLLTEFQGNSILVPVKGFKKIIEKIVLKEYDHTAISIQRLTRDLCIAESTVRNILRSHKITPAETGQLNLFYSRGQQ